MTCGQVVAEHNGGWQRGYVYGDGGNLIAQQQYGSVEWTHIDPVTKGQQLRNTAGTWMSRVDVDPWGGETNRSSNSYRQSRKFTTYTRDGSGADEAMHRRYNRWWSRFDQPDPYDGSYSLGDPQSLNRYAYVQNDPVNFVDPSGLQGTSTSGGSYTATHVNGVLTQFSGNIGSIAVIVSGGGGGGRGGTLGGLQAARVQLALSQGYVYSYIDPIGGGGGSGQNSVRLPPIIGPSPEAPPPPMPSGACDGILTRLFGGTGTVAASVYEPSGVSGGGNNYIHHLANNGTIHLYTNARATPTTVGLYAPANGTYVPKGSGPYPEKDYRGNPTGNYSNVQKYSYQGGLVVSFFHVGRVPSDANIQKTNVAGSSLIGIVAGPGGSGTNYNHTHIQFDINGVRTDPRSIYCKP